jgi:Tol biopolymer transport system component
VACLAVLTLGQVAISIGPAHATFPGHNGYVALQGETAEHGVQLYSADPETGSWRRVTDVTGVPVFPDWSPNGRRLAFEVVPPSGEQCRIWLAASDGRRARNLSQHRRGCEQNPSFTPDGHRIVFVAQRCESCTERIWTMDLHGRRRRVITDSPPGFHSVDPNISPDGRLLSFVAENEQNRAGLFVVGMDGHRRHNVVPTSYDVERKHDWSPDGQRLLFDDNANEATLPSNLMTVRPDGSDLRHITTFNHQGDNARKAHVGSYSPDGRWIVYRLTVDDQPQLLQRPVGGGAPQVITLDQGPTFNGNGDWGALSGVG